MENSLTLGNESSFISISFLHVRNSLMHTASLPPSLTLSSFPLSHNLSAPENEGSARDVVVERRWSWSSVMDREELVGRMRAVSRLPQYLQLHELMVRFNGDGLT